MAHRQATKSGCRLASLRLRNLRRLHTNSRRRCYIVTKAAHRRRSAWVKPKLRPFHSSCAAESVLKQGQRRRTTSNFTKGMPGYFARAWNAFSKPLTGFWRLLARMIYPRRQPETPCDHSCRNAVIGSTRIARRAGIKVAKSAKVTSAITATARTSGS
jgi:hypothetical protein